MHGVIDIHLFATENLKMLKGPMGIVKLQGAVKEIIY